MGHNLAPGEATPNFALDCSDAAAGGEGRANVPSTYRDGAFGRDCGLRIEEMIASRTPGTSPTGRRNRATTTRPFGTRRVGKTGGPTTETQGTPEVRSSRIVVTLIPSVFSVSRW